MASPPIPPPLQHLATRPFSFYPPIINIEHNEWLFRKATWSEILVVNCKTSAEIWIPRRFLGEVSRIEDPVLIVGLNRELEYEAGAVWPYQRRVIEMPVAVGESPPSNCAPSPDRTGPAPVVGIRLESNDRGVFKLIGGVVAAGVCLSVAAIYFSHIWEPHVRGIAFTARDSAFENLTSRDDYVSVVEKLGTPASDRWRPDSGEIKVRALAYPDRKYTVILMGIDSSTATYVGTMDDHWKPLRAASLPTGGSTLDLLRNLKRF